MRTAYTVNGKEIELSELTCPNGHTNRKIDFEHFDYDKDSLICEFIHISNHFKFQKENMPKTEFEKELFASFGIGNPIAALARCNICNGLFFFVTIDEDIRKGCRCFDCEISRLKKGRSPIDEYSLAKVKPRTYGRIRLRLPEWGRLSAEDEKRLCEFIDNRKPVKTIPLDFELKAMPDVKDIEYGFPF